MILIVWPGWWRSGRVFDFRAVDLPGLDSRQRRAFFHDKFLPCLWQLKPWALFVANLFGHRWVSFIWFLLNSFAVFSNLICLVNTNPSSLSLCTLFASVQCKRLIYLSQCVSEDPSHQLNINVYNDSRGENNHDAVGWLQSLLQEALRRWWWPNNRMPRKVHLCLPPNFSSIAKKYWAFPDSLYVFS